MNEPKCPHCGTPRTTQEIAEAQLTRAYAVLEYEQQNPRAQVTVPALELVSLCQQVLAPPAAPTAASTTAPSPVPTAQPHELTA